MVLQQSHRRHAASPSTRIDANRILGISSTLALNLLAMGLLLIPMTLPPPPITEAPKRDLTLVEVVPVKPKPQTVPVERTKPQPHPQPVVRRTRTETPPVVEQTIVDEGTLQADPVVDLPVTDVAPPAQDITPAGPVQGMRLEYAAAPAPAYPRDAVRRGLEGVVMLRVLVDMDGKPLEVSVHKSSGHGILDREAQRHVLRHWTFRAATQDGRPVQAIGIVPIEFSLRNM
jgi:protein TonB